MFSAISSDYFCVSSVCSQFCQFCQFQPRSKRGNNSTVQPASPQANRCEPPDCLAVRRLSGFWSTIFGKYGFGPKIHPFSWTSPWRSWRRRGTGWCSFTTCATEQKQEQGIFVLVPYLLILALEVLQRFPELTTLEIISVQFQTLLLTWYDRHSFMNIWFQTNCWQEFIFSNGRSNWKISGGWRGT